MKVLCLMLVLALSALCASAQVLSNPSATPEVKVIQKKWRIDFRNPALEKDPNKIMDEREKEERKRKETDRMNETRAQQGMPAVVPSVRSPSHVTEDRGLSATYIYELKVTNTGPKEIRVITWEYVFFDPGTTLEVGRQRFVSKVSISQGKTKNLVMRSASSPTGAIDATQAGKKSGDLYSEQVVIKSVGYADGSIWHAPSN